MNASAETGLMFGENVALMFFLMVVERGFPRAPVLLHAVAVGRPATPPTG
jgi:hypothetical protein